jgi:hypothetical protein
LAIAATLDYCVQKTSPALSTFGADFRGVTQPPRWESAATMAAAGVGTFPQYSVPFYDFVLHSLLGGFSEPRGQRRNTFKG